MDYALPATPRTAAAAQQLAVAVAQFNRVTDGNTARHNEIVATLRRDANVLRPETTHALTEAAHVHMCAHAEKRLVEEIRALAAAVVAAAECAERSAVAARAMSVLPA